jgi:hypothetical protein
MILSSSPQFHQGLVARNTIDPGLERFSVIDLMTIQLYFYECLLDNIFRPVSIRNNFCAVGIHTIPKFFIDKGERFRTSLLKVKKKLLVSNRVQELDGGW